jgi:hypothetical protein
VHGVSVAILFIWACAKGVPSFTPEVAFPICPSSGFLCRDGLFNAIDDLYTEGDRGAGCADLVLPLGGREVHWGQATGGEAVG